MQRYAHYLMKGRRIHGFDEEDLLQDTLYRLSVTSSKQDIADEDLKKFASVTMKHYYWKYIKSSHAKKNDGLVFDITDQYPQTQLQNLSSSASAVDQLVLQEIKVHAPLSYQLAMGYSHPEINPDTANRSGGAWAKAKRTLRKEKKKLQTIVFGVTEGVCPQ